MKSLVVIMAAALVAVGSAQARLGETREQIIQRYGQPIRPLSRLLNYDDKGHWGTFFQFNGYIITVMFDAGSVSVREAYSRWDGLPLRDTETFKFLDSNAGGHTWKQVPNPDVLDVNTLDWLRSDDEVIAFYNSIWKVFVVKRLVPRQPDDTTGQPRPGF